MRFFNNHALLHHSGQHCWSTVRGGSREYVWRLQAALDAAGVEIRLNTPVRRVAAADGGIRLRARGGETEPFDEVIFATHSDDTLGMVEMRGDGLRRALGDVRYQSNRAVLHADASIMPKRRAVWSSWNYAEPVGPRPQRIDLTYWMNSLQPIPKNDPLFVTLNASRPIDPRLVYDEVEFRHPVYDGPALAAQQTIRRLNGRDRIWFCGAWMRNGFHEDGFASAADVVEAVARRDAEAAFAAK